MQTSLKSVLEKGRFSTTAGFTAHLQGSHAKPAERQETCWLELLLLLPPQISDPHQALKCASTVATILQEGELMLARNSKEEIHTS